MCLSRSSWVRWAYGWRKAFHFDIDWQRHSKRYGIFLEDFLNKVIVCGIDAHIPTDIRKWLLVWNEHFILFTPLVKLSYVCVGGPFPRSHIVCCLPFFFIFAVKLVVCFVKLSHILIWIRWANNPNTNLSLRWYTIRSHNAYIHTMKSQMLYDNLFSGICALSLENRKVNLNRNPQWKWLRN